MDFLELKKVIDQENCKLLIQILDNHSIKLFFMKMDSEGNTLLSYCICNKQNIADLVLQYIMAKCNCVIRRKKLLNQVNNNGESYLFLAVKNNNYELSKKLFLCGVSDEHVTKYNKKVKVNKENCITENVLNNYYEKINADLERNNQLEIKQTPFYNTQNKFNNNPFIQEKIQVPQFFKLFNNNTYHIQDDTNLNNGSYNIKDNNDLNNDSEQYVKLIYNKFNLFNENNLYGGKNNQDTESLISINFNKNNIESEMLGGGKNKSSRKIKKSSRSKFKKQSSELHDKAINEIMKLNYDIEDAKLIKAGLYSMVKDKYPDLNNYTRAEKMLEMVTKENIEKINLSKLKKLIEKNKKDKETQKDNKDVKKDKKKK